MPVLDQRYDPAFPIDDLIEHPDNPRRGDEASIDASMAAHGFYGAVVVQSSTGRIIVGNHRTRVARRRGETTLPVLFVDVDDDRARRILLVDNRANDRAGYDQAELVRLLADLQGTDDALAGTGWTDTDLAALLRDIERDAPGRGSLVDRYVVPPFTVLDARAGYWRDRKKRWLAWGLRSAEGRADRLVGSGGFANAAAYVAPVSDVLHPGAVSRPWAAGTSIFDPVLAEVMYRWFSPPGGLVADPFCGGSVRGAVASALGRRYAGYDLRPEQVEANEDQGRELGLDPFPEWRVGDARAAVWDPCDVVFTCPPYWHLEHYSDDPADLCNARDAAEFEMALRLTLGPATEALVDDSFAVVVLGYVRDDTGRLVDLPALCGRALSDLGLVPYNELVLLTSVSTAAIRTHIFDKSRKAVPVHQRVVVAVKGDPARAAARCGPVDVDADAATVAAWTDPDEAALGS